jgi:hypothetical protein
MLLSLKKLSFEKTRASCKPAKPLPTMIKS